MSRASNDAEQGARYAELRASWQAGLEEVERPVTVEHVTVGGEPASRASPPQDEPRGERD